MSVIIPRAEALKHMQAMDESMKAVEAAYPDSPEVKAARASMCDMLTAFNAHAEKSGVQPLDGGGKGSPPPPGG